MQYVLMKMVKNLGIAFLGKKMLFVLLRVYVKATKRTWDDTALDFVEALVEGDVPAIQKYGVEVARLAMEEMNKDKEEVR